MDGWDVMLIISLIVLAGVLGGFVNTALERKSEEDENENPYPASSLYRNIPIGIGAAFLVPLFLSSVKSEVLTSLLGRIENVPMYLVFFGYCVLASISARAFITTLTDKIFQNVKDLQKEAAANKKEIEKAKDEVEKTKTSSEEAKKVAQAANDAIRLGTSEKTAITTQQKPASRLNMTDADFATVLKEADPWKDKFGKLTSRNDRTIRATLTPMSDHPELAVVTLQVFSTNSRNPLSGTVQFFLHPTFNNFHPEVPVVNESASINFTSSGAFTVGATCDGGATLLELDLADLPDAWEPWRSA